MLLWVLLVLLRLVLLRLLLLTELIVTLHRLHGLLHGLCHRRLLPRVAPLLVGTRHRGARRAPIAGRKGGGARPA